MDVDAAGEMARQHEIRLLLYPRAPLTDFCTCVRALNLFFFLGGLFGGLFFGGNSILPSSDFHKEEHTD